MSPEIIFDPYTGLYSRVTDSVKSSAIRDLMSVTGRSDVISFAAGQPLVAGVPQEEIAGVFEEITRFGLDEALQYCETEGRWSLKQMLADVMSEEGLSADPGHILVTTGSQQALDLLGRLFIDPGDHVVIEGPSYVGALTAFYPGSPSFVTVPLDDEGLRVGVLEEELERLGEPKPKFLYVVPNFHNPAGVTMSGDRRKRLVKIAQERDLLLIEDNPYGLLRFEGEPVETLASLDQDRVIYVGTLSKIVSPGIRVGWVCAPAPIIDRLATLKQSADLCSSQLNQMFAEEFLRRGLHLRNLEALKPVYRSRRDLMLEGLKEFFPSEASWTTPQGGLFIWASLPEYMDTNKMLPLAIEEKVAFVPGSAFYADGSGRNHMRLNFSFPSEEDIEKGAKRLGEVIREEMELYRSLGLDKA